MLEDKFRIAIEKHISFVLGYTLSINDICDMPLEVFRSKLEEKRGKLLDYKSYFPFIGTSEGKYLVSHEKVEQMFEEAF